MIPRQFGPALFSLILSGSMSLLVSGITTFRTVGMRSDAVNLWASAWLAAWAVAFPVVMLVAPLARALVQRLVAKD